MSIEEVYRGMCLLTVEDYGNCLVHFDNDEALTEIQHRSLESLIARTSALRLVRATESKLEALLASGPAQPQDEMPTYKLRSVSSDASLLNAILNRPSQDLIGTLRELGMNLLYQMDLASLLEWVEEFEEYLDYIDVMATPWSGKASEIRNLIKSGKYIADDQVWVYMEQPNSIRIFSGAANLASIVDVFFHKWRAGAAECFFGWDLLSTNNLEKIKETCARADSIEGASLEAYVALKAYPPHLEAKYKDLVIDSA